jgi:hypothetical protein
MPRLPYAAKTLIGQVQDEKPKARPSMVGDVDGLGVWRTIKFDKTTSKWLEPRLDAGDERLSTVKMTDDGYLHVEFAAGTIADHRHEFDLTSPGAGSKRALSDEQGPEGG